MTMTDDRERKAAEAKFKKSERATEGAKAMADYNAEGEAERAKTVRLKAQRLAKAPIQEYARVPEFERAIRCTQKSRIRYRRRQRSQGDRGRTSQG
jgi:hypothetical protein